MSVMATPRALDVKPVLELVKQRGECSFNDAMAVLQRKGMEETDARDALWQLLSDGVLEFTSTRKLRLPVAEVRRRAAG